MSCQIGVTKTGAKFCPLTGQQMPSCEEPHCSMLWGMQWGCLFSMVVLLGYIAFSITVQTPWLGNKATKLPFHSLNSPWPFHLYFSWHTQS